MTSELEFTGMLGYQQVARALDVDRSYVGRTLRLTALAPDIVGAVLAGNEPDGMSLERLSKGVPVVWAEQRRPS